jgi:hypothetical protein
VSQFLKTGIENRKRTEKKDSVKNTHPIVIPLLSFDEKFQKKKEILTNLFFKNEFFGGSLI